MEHTAKKVHESKLLPSAWIHDGGEALGNLGNKIFGGYKLATQTASPGSLSRLWVKVIDHHTIRYTPWFRNTQMLPHSLRILGNPRTQAIDLQIPTQPGQTSLEAILLTLQIMGCGENPQYDERIRVFKDESYPEDRTRSARTHTKRTQWPTQSTTPLHTRMDGSANNVPTC